MKMRFDFSLPEWLRPKRLREETALAALAELETTDVRLQALLEVVQEQFAVECQAGLRHDLTDSQRAFQNGRAASLHSLLDRIEASRVGAREERERRLREVVRRSKN